MVATSKDGMQNSRIRGRRPSIFSSGFHTSGSQLYDTDFGDLANDKTVRNQSQVDFIISYHKTKNASKKLCQRLKNFYGCFYAYSTQSRYLWKKT